MSSSLDDKSTKEISNEFAEYVNTLISNENIKGRLTYFFGKTNHDQEFVFTMETRKTSPKYAVRLMVDDEHKNLKAKSDNIDKLCYREFRSSTDANLYIKKTSDEFKSGIFTKDFLYRIRVLPQDGLANPDMYLKPGDHIQRTIEYTQWSHEGIYLGDGMVAHINSDTPKANNTDATVVTQTFLKGSSKAKIDEFEIFVHGQKEVRLFIPLFRRRTRIDVCAAARRLVDERYAEGEYNFLVKNCQHFATLCETGEEYASDIEKILEACSKF